MSRYSKGTPERDELERTYLVESVRIVGVSNQMDELVVAIDERDQEISLLRGAAAADNQRLIAAAKRAGVTFMGCDTPEHLADEIERLREQLESAIPRDEYDSIRLKIQKRWADDLEKVEAQRDEARRERDELQRTLDTAAAALKAAKELL